MRIILSIILALSLQLSQAQLPQKSYALTNVNLFNGVDNKITPNVIIFIKDKKIERIGKTGDVIGKEYEIVDCMGNYAAPGMIDAHTHISTLESAKRALLSGVTTVRSAGVSSFEDVAIRELAKSGRIAGPDIIPAGVFIRPTIDDDVLADPRLVSLLSGVSTDEELKLLVNVNIDRGAEVIKTRSTERAGLPETDPRQQSYTQHQVKIIVDEAAKRKVPVMVHAHGDEGARAAVLAGAKSIEHASFLTEQTLLLMKEKGTFLVPTFITLEDLTTPGGDFSSAALELRGKFMLPSAEKVFRKAHSLGVKIATGADNFYSSTSTSRISLEAEHFVRMGMTNFEALQSATVVSADLIGLSSRTGRIVPGYEADIIILPANPLEDIKALQDVLIIVSNGYLPLKRLPFGKE
ncbi:MAG: amidohydrolase family protein [Cyclobacteriaceae bacterium]|nr:amidohydrolase family protein [Cyclobacteriaceae bacterium]